MKVLVAVASRHGSTVDIARRLAERLDALGHEATVLELGDGHRHGHDHPHGHEPALAAHDAVVIGSAIYEAHWLRSARTFVLRNASRLQQMPAFLFSSGPIGDSEHVAIDTVKIDELVHAIDAVEHRVFSGRLDRGELGRMERWIVDVVRARDGDFRDWDGIDTWAAAVDAHLRATAGARST
jgi:menaquinone-dependent protoporphyrinogen oxidase